VDNENIIRQFIANLDNKGLDSSLLKENIFNFEQKFVLYNAIRSGANLEMIANPDIPSNEMEDILDEQRFIIREMRKHYGINPDNYNINQILELNDGITHNLDITPYLSYEYSAEHMHVAKTFQQEKLPGLEQLNPSTTISEFCELRNEMRVAHQLEINQPITASNDFITNSNITFSEKSHDSLLTEYDNSHVRINHPVVKTALFEYLILENWLYSAQQNILKIEENKNRIGLSQEDTLLREVFTKEFNKIKDKINQISAQNCINMSNPDSNKQIAPLIKESTTLQQTINRLNKQETSGGLSRDENMNLNTLIYHVDELQQQISTVCLKYGGTVTSIVNFSIQEDFKYISDSCVLSKFHQDNLIHLDTFKQLVHNFNHMFEQALETQQLSSKYVLLDQNKQIPINSNQDVLEYFRIASPDLIKHVEKLGHIDTKGTGSLYLSQEHPPTLTRLISHELNLDLICELRDSKNISSKTFKQNLNHETQR
jgi:hypothetical protein